MKIVALVALIIAALVLAAGLTWAADDNGAAAPAKAAAQADAAQDQAPAAPAPAPAKKPAPPKAAPAKAAAPATGAPIPERVNSLEKQNVVLSEDMGKARLEQRMQLETLAKKQAEAIAQLNKQLDDQQKKMEAEKAKQAKRNRNMWMAVGALALGVVAAH